jgi:hypothetical protein
MVMTKYKIIDNFLNEKDFDKLSYDILPSIDDQIRQQQINNFNWIYVKNQVNSWDEPDYLKKVTDIELLDPRHRWVFGNSSFIRGVPFPSFPVLVPLINKIFPLAIFRVQSVFTVQQDKMARSAFHIDYTDETQEYTDMVTSIFYMNTTNGPTILEDGTEIECRANRLVSYPYKTYHSGVLCTDQPYRIVINFNYFKNLDFS